MLKNELFSFIANEIFLGIAVFKQPQKNCVYVNKLAREYLGLAQDADLQLITPRSFYAPNTQDRFRPLSDDVITAEGLSQDIVIHRGDGGRFIADVGVRNLRSENDEYLLLMIRDVTLQKKLQRELTTKQEEIQKAYSEILQQNSALKELDKAKDKFIALTTHELRTPLSAMIATSEVLHLKIYDTDEQRDEFIKTIYTEGLHLLEIVNDILDFSKIQAGKMVFFISENDMKPSIEMLTKSFTQMAEAKAVTLKVEFKSEDLKAYFDTLRFKQAFSNVLNNAIKFTHPNTTVHIHVWKADKKVSVAIKDEGPGIPENSRSKVFNEFETVGNVNTHHKGTGLGMPITKRIMDSMGGSVILETEEGKGACFTLELPTEKVLAEDLYRARPTDVDDLAA